LDKIIFFKINGFNLWNGGVNYIKQLKIGLKKESIDLVVVINDFDKAGIKRLNDSSVDYRVIETNKYFKFFNFFLLKLGVSFSFLKDHNVDNKSFKIIYHGLIPIKYIFSKHQTVYWLPDILHEIFPNNFSKFHYYKRLIFTNINLKITNEILLSSHSIKKQLNKIYKIEKKIIIYQFSSTINLNSNFKINFSKPFVLFPHEFWSHKRQEKIIKLANDNSDYFFILTGNNRRNKKNSSFSRFDFELKKLKYNNLINLGEIDWGLLNQLYLESNYIGNLSDYEGWNTSVEIAKSLNKNLILSKIDVHVEQTNEYNNVIWFEEGVKLREFNHRNNNDSYEDEKTKRLKILCKDLQ
jgi:hypothetical protein